MSRKNSFNTGKWLFGKFHVTTKKQNYKHMKHPCTAVHKKE